MYNSTISTKKHTMQTDIESLVHCHFHKNCMRRLGIVYPSPAAPPGLRGSDGCERPLHIGDQRAWREPAGGGGVTSSGASTSCPQRHLGQQGAQLATDEHRYHRRDTIQQERSDWEDMVEPKEGPGRGEGTHIVTVVSAVQAEGHKGAEGTRTRLAAFAEQISLAPEVETPTILQCLLLPQTNANHSGDSGWLLLSSAAP